MGETTADTSDNDSRGIMRFFRNPAVGIAGSIASVLSLVLAVYFYEKSSQYVELVSFVHPAKAVVVKTGQASRLRVLLGDEELRSDVTAAQVAVWNRGTLPIRSADVLSQLKIRTDPPVPILEASIRKKSRDVVGLSLDPTQRQNGIVGVSWNILEQGDGAIIQLVYAGGPEVAIRAAAVIEGQAEIHDLYYGGAIKSPSEQWRDQRSEYRTLWVLLGLACILNVGLLFFLRRASVRMVFPPMAVVVTVILLVPTLW